MTDNNQTTTQHEEDTKQSANKTVVNKHGTTVNKHKLSTVTKAILAALVLLTTAGVIWYQHAEQQLHQKAYTACTHTSKTAKQTSQRLQKSMQDASKIANSEQQAADPATVKTLANTLHAIKEDKLKVSCNTQMNTSQLEHNRQIAETWNTQQAQLLTKLKQQHTAASASIAKKTLTDAQNEFTSKKEEAQKLLADSENKITDNTSRQALQETINEVNQLASAKAEDYVKAADKLDQAMRTVRDSINTEAQQQPGGTPLVSAPASNGAGAGNNQGALSYQPQAGNRQAALAPAPAAPAAPRAPAPAPAPQQPMPNDDDDWQSFDPSFDDIPLW